ncbi:MAG TPA: DUF192 domain-containing protein [Anaerolineales bacterium]|nr:DUF192 domain-containing protein [Anaerolineales bacterium]
MPAFARVTNLDRTNHEPVRIALCNTFLSRLRGVLGRKEIRSDQGVLLVGNRDSRADAAIHMLFVPFDLAVFWINSDMHVVDKILARSWRLAYIPQVPARYVLELHPAHYPDYEIGNNVRIIDV